MKRRFGIVRGAAGGWLSATVLLILASPAPALAQSSDLQPLVDRLDRLERDVKNLNLKIFRGQTPTGAPAGNQGGAAAGSEETAHVYARLDTRLSALEDDLRSTTGRVEDLTYQIKQLKQRLDKLVGDVDYRLSALERRGTSETASARPGVPPATAAPNPPAVETVPPGSEGPSFAKPPGVLGTLTKEDLEKYGAKEPPLQPAAPVAPTPAPAAKPAESKILPEGTPQDQYAYAFGLLRQANYDQAEVALQEFLKRHGDDPLAGNARYWLGETYYVRGAYVQAAEVFLKGYQANPKGSKAPDTLLKLGMSLANLDKKREACAAFDKLGGDFPDASVSIKKTLARERQRSGCR